MCGECGHHRLHMIHLITVMMVGRQLSSSFSKPLLLISACCQHPAMHPAGTCGGPHVGGPQQELMIALALVSRRRMLVQIVHVVFAFRAGTGSLHLYKTFTCCVSAHKHRDLCRTQVHSAISHHCLSYPKQAALMWQPGRFTKWGRTKSCPDPYQVQQVQMSLTGRNSAADAHQTREAINHRSWCSLRLVSPAACAANAATWPCNLVQPQGMNSTRRPPQSRGRTSKTTAACGQRVSSEAAECGLQSWPTSLKDMT